MKINEGAAAEYLLAEQVYGSKTLFCNLFRLEPGSILEWSPNGTTLSVNSLLTYRSDYSELGEDVDKWARAFEEVWHDVMADLAGRANGRIIVGLSSGLDSRTIAGGLRQIDQPFTAFTYGSITSAEVRVAASVSSVLDAPHVLIPYGPGTILHRPDFCHANLDDGLSAVNATEGWFCDALPLIGRTFVTGYGGDALWGNDRLWGVRGIEQVRQLLVQRLGGRSGQIAPLVEPEFARKLIALIRGAVEESTAGLTSMNRPDTGLLWLLQNRVVGFGWNFVSVIRRMGLQYENPFFTSKMLKYSLSMPPSVRAHGRAYLRVHRDYFPATAQFARNINGAIPARDTNYLYLSGFARAAQQIAGMAVNSPRYAARRLGSIALSRLASRLARVGYTEFGDRLVRNQSPFAHDFAARELPYYRDRLAALIEQARDVGCPLLSRAGLTDALDALRAGRVPAPPIVLGRVAALAAWTAGHA